MHLHGLTQQHPHSHIEFSLTYQQRLLYVLLDDKGAGSQAETLARRSRIAHSFPLRLFLLLFLSLLARLLDIFTNLILFSFFNLVYVFFPIHQLKIVKQYLLHLIERIEYLYAPSSVEACGLQEPQIAILRKVGVGVQWTGENIHLLLDIWVLPGHVGLEFADEVRVGLFFPCFSRVVLVEEA